MLYSSSDIAMKRCVSYSKQFTMFAMFGVTESEWKRESDETQCEDGFPSWQGGFYVGDGRMEDRCPLENMVRYETLNDKTMHIDNYVRKYWNIKPDNPRRIIILIVRVDFRHLKICFVKTLYTKRASRVYTNLSMKNFEITKKDIRKQPVKNIID